MGLGKTYSTKYLADSNNNTGAAGQVLSTTSTGIDWADANTLPGSGLWLENGNDIYNSNSGNVGIGTTSPSFGTGGGLQITNATQANLRFTDTSASTFITDLALSNDDFYIINRAASGQLKFRVNASTEAMTINSQGNVGIGTTSPVSKLDIRGRTDINLGAEGLYFKAGGDTANNGRPLEFTSSSNNGSNGALHTINATSGNGAMSLNTAGVSRIYMDRLGLVGIGTTSPGYTLEIAGPSTTSFAYQRTGVSANKWGFHSDNDATYWQNLTSGNLLFTLQNSGNVGIGTTSPKAKLDVNGRFCVDSKAVTVTDTFTTCLTVNLSNHTGCHVVITVFGDWSGHSSAAYRGEFFLQNGANSYAEPGIILRQDDNTSVGTDQIICQIVDPTSTANPKDFQIQIRHTDTTSPASWTGQLTYTVQGQFNSIT